MNRRNLIVTTGAAAIVAWFRGNESLALHGDASSLGTGTFNSVVFNRDGRQLLTSSASIQTRLAQTWDLQTGKEIRRFEGHSAVIRAATYGRDETFIVTGAGTGILLNHIPSDYTARVWDVMTGQELRKFSGHKSFVYAAVFNRDSTRILTTGRDSVAILWDVKTGKEIFRFPGIDFQKEARFSPDGSLVLAPRGGDGIYYAQLWDATTGKELRRCEGHTKEVTDARFSHDGKLLLTSSDDGTARLWDPRTAKEVRSFGGHKGAIISAKFGVDEKRIITASSDTTVRIWDASTGVEIRSFVHPAPVEMADLNLAGTRLLTRSDPCNGRGLSRPVAVLWDVTTGKEVTQIPLPGVYGRNHALFSPDGKSFFVTLHRYAILCNAESGEAMRDYR